MESKDGTDYFHNYDFIVKWLADALVGRTLDVPGLESAPIEQVFAFEIADINVRAGRVDVMVRDRAGALFHIEEQRNLQRRDLYRFAGYHFLGAKSWGANVTDVIPASGDVDPDAQVIEPPSGTYRPTVVDFSQRDGKERLEQIRAQILDGTFESRLELVVLPLYGKEKGAKRSVFAEEVVRFQMELCRAEKISSRLPAATLILSNKMIDRQRIEAMWEEIKMLDIRCEDMEAFEALLKRIQASSSQSYPS